jgi:hypothetical protein
MAAHPAVQPALDGSIPDEPRRQAADFEEWLEEVWPAYEAAADSGEPFTISAIAEAHRLPDPPRPQAQWGHLPGRLMRAGLIQQHYVGRSRRPSVHSSLVLVWIGVPAHLRERRAAEAAGRAGDAA